VVAVRLGGTEMVAAVREARRRKHRWMPSEGTESPEAFYSSYVSPSTASGSSNASSAG